MKNLPRYALILLFLTLSLLPRDRDEAVKIGIIDMKLLVEFFIEDQDYMDKLNKNRSKAMNDIKRLRKKVAILEKKLKDNEAAHNYDNENLIREIEAFKENLYNMVMLKNKELKDQEESISFEILGVIYKQVKKVGEKGNYALILDKNEKFILESVEEIDITAKILKALEKEKDILKSN